MKEGPCMWSQFLPLLGLCVSEFPGLCELCEQLREGKGSQKRSFLLAWALNLPRPQVSPVKPLKMAAQRRLLATPREGQTWPPRGRRGRFPGLAQQPHFNIFPAPVREAEAAAPKPAER